MPSSQPSHNTKLLILGGGPGGYTAAFRAADLGLQVTLVDAQKNLGGVCLHCGCIPSKSLLHAARILTDSREAKDIGIDFGQPKLDVAKLRAWKNSVIQRLTGGISFLVKQHKVEFLQGRATFLDSNSVKVEKADGTSENISFDHAIIATGSQSIPLPFAPVSRRVMDSTTALDLENIPQRLLVIGGGYIGLELGTAYAAFGSEVSVVEMMPTILPGVDRDLVSILERRLKKTFKSILLNTKVIELKESAHGISVTFEEKSGQRQQGEFDKVLVAVGRKPNAADLGLKNTKVKIDSNGFIEVDASRRTADPKIYAVGDVTGNPMLAHKASAEGHIAAEVIAGKKSSFTPKAIPAVVFTDPEIAWCGLTETEAKEKNLNVKIVKMPWAASGRATTMNRTDGVTKIIADGKTEKILGIAFVGVGAGDLISEGVLAIEMNAKVSDLNRTIHPHPTLSETLMDTAGLFYK